MNIPDDMFESLENFVGVKILKFFDADACSGSGSGIRCFRPMTPGSEINIPDPQHCLYLYFWKV